MNEGSDSTGAPPPPSPPAPPPPVHDPYAAWRGRDFRILALASFLTVVGEQMVGVALGWQLYERTHSALALGMVGLVQVVPVVLLALPAGHVANRYDRRRVVCGALALVALGSAGLALLSYAGGPLPLVYAWAPDMRRLRTL